MGTATITEWKPGEGVGAKVDGGVSLTVDFDPKSLRLSYTPTGVTGANTVTKTGAWSKFAAQQTGQSTTLAVELTFDTSQTGTSVQDRTEQIVQLTLPNTSVPAKPARRVARFQWGSFIFYGVVQSLTQTIDFFSETGIPLRATVQLTLSDVKQPNPDTARPPVTAPVGFGATGAVGASTGTPVGTTPLTLSQSGDSVQSIAARAGAGVSWKTIAAANGIDNPRLLPPGTVLDTSVRIT
ncbi:CIS tube protein [Streptomyces sp. NBC_01262]|uniref:CIS tube protein n=1 Tax=Streptomyces sp. NBC_01262 TaxID=2903803 RepID=UPI002E344BAD|nr:LysM peptidoglycan-binding domain-containing protein [Streptomyces sp. NBC_01262]